jgi:hypothetical protein
VPRGVERNLLRRPDAHGPRLDEQDVQVPQRLGGDAAFRHGGVALPPLDFATDERREELGVEPSVLVAEPIVRGGRRVVSEELLGKASLRQRLAHIAGEGLVGREGEVGVTGPEREVVRGLRQAMKAMEPMSPTAHDHQLAQPRPERCHEPCEGFEILHSAASLDELVENTLADQVGLFSSTRRVR